jgi:hypothetical protein
MNDNDDWEDVFADDENTPSDNLDKNIFENPYEQIRDEFLFSDFEIELDLANYELEETLTELDWLK